MTVKEKSKVGPVTLAAGLIIGGLTLLLYNFGAISSLEWLWKLWPVLLIGLGVEYLLKKRAAPGRDVHFHVPSFLLILVMIIAGCLLYAATSFGKNISSFIDGFPWSHANYTYSRNWESGPLEIMAGEQLIIENKTGGIKLLPAQGGGLNLKASIHSPESGPARELADRVAPEIKRDGGRVSVQAPDTGNSLMRPPYTDLEVSIPSGVNVYVKSGTGRVTAENMQANLNVEGSVGTIDLNAISGNIEVVSNTGRIRIFEPDGDLLAKNNTGSIEVSSERPLSGKYDLESSTGMVSLLLPKQSDLVINAESRTGRVSVEGLANANNADKTGPGDEFSGQLGNGKGQANLRVGTGAIKITAR